MPGFGLFNLYVFGFALGWKPKRAISELSKYQNSILELRALNRLAVGSTAVTNNKSQTIGIPEEEAS